MNIIAALFITIVATTLGAISGIGGGVIIKPVLDAVSIFSVSKISFLSGCTVLSMAIVSLIYSKKGTVEIEAVRGTLLAVGGAVGGILGKQIFEFVKTTFERDSVVGVVQSLLMIILTLGVLIYTSKKEKIKTHDVKNKVVCFMIGCALGLISAFLGIGGGPINLTVLSFFFSMDSKTAALNSIYIIFFSQISSLGTTALTNRIPEIDITILACMIVGGILGGFLGRGFSQKMSNRQVDMLFISMLIGITAISCYNLFIYIVC